MEKTFIFTLFTYVLADSEEDAIEIVKDECDYPILKIKEVKKEEVGIPWDE